MTSIFDVICTTSPKRIFILIVDAMYRTYCLAFHLLASCFRVFIITRINSMTAVWGMGKLLTSAGISGPYNQTKLAPSQLGELSANRRINSFNCHHARITFRFIQSCGPHLRLESREDIEPTRIAITECSVAGLHLKGPGNEKKKKKKIASRTPPNSRSVFLSPPEQTLTTRECHN